MASNQEEKFELIASMRAGWCKNQTQSANKILITPIAEPGCLELYNSKKTLHYRDVEYKDESIQICQYELRWKPISQDSSIQELKISITDEYEFIKYTEVKDGVMFLLRKKQAWKDHFPYFFWCQEADATVYNRFLSSFSLCFEMLQKDKLELENMKSKKLIDINEFLRERDVIKIFDNPAVCAKFYPYVSECLRTPEGLKKIVRSPSFKKNIATFQLLMDKGGCDMVCSLYMFDISELPSEGVIDVGSRSYLKRIELWAKQELEKEQEK